MRLVAAALLCATSVLALAGAAEARVQAAPAQASMPLPPDGRFAELVAEHEAWSRAQDPISAGQEGDKAALRRLPDLSLENDRAVVAKLREFLARAEAIPADQLSPDVRFDHAFFVRQLRLQIEGYGFDPARLAVSNEGGPGVYMNYFAAVTRVGSLEDAEAWIMRLEGVPKLYEQTTENARRGIRTGWTQPRSTVESGLRADEAHLAFTVENDPLLQPLRNLPATISAEDQARLRARAAAIVTDQIMPARRAWARFVREEYLPKARRGLGVGSVRDGRAYYAYLARSYTTTDLTPDQIHEIGQSEVRRIRAEMEKIVAEVGFQGTFAEFLTFLRTDPQFYAQSREDLLEKASEIAKRADDRLPALFYTLPRLPYGVRPVPRDIEDTYTTGRYFPGSPENGVAGGYIVNTGKLDQRPLYELVSLTLHEAVPGHHLQIALQQEQGELPWFRRNAQVTAFVEGWGLYAEWLGYEMGMFRTPYERFGALSYEMWRACRLVADTGLHYKGWTLEQARACFRDNSALAPHNIETELQRYVADPGQALAYKIGELKLRELRARAEQRLGSRFDVRRYHDAVLLGGPLPLDLLEQRIDAWIATQAASAPQ